MTIWVQTFMSLSFHEVHLIESRCLTWLISFDVNRNLLTRALKNIFSPFSVVFFHFASFSVHQTTKEFLAFIKEELYMRL